MARPRTIGFGSRPKQYKLTAVSYDYKLRVLRYLDTSTIANMVDTFFPGVTTAEAKTKKCQVYDWKKAREMIETKCSRDASFHQRDRCAGLSTTLSEQAEEQAEEQAVRWINSLRADGVAVAALMLKVQAQEVYKCSSPCSAAFAVSWSWTKHFLRRHKLSIRRRTREGQTTLANAEKRAEEQVHAKMQGLGVKGVDSTMRIRQVRYASLLSSTYALITFFIRPQTTSMCHHPQSPAAVPRRCGSSALEDE
ncbi:unnamed protein product [Phytophthora lilii]|uniref:Unnamed protein product n=1 Tax=Phytophthora lilii TaxID=2077276 RepID=A0A9W6TWL9_9STRA|nr:unnamed protein product [Phytophthora lilii]